MADTLNGSTHAMAYCKLLSYTTAIMLQVMEVAGKLSREPVSRHFKVDMKRIGRVVPAETIFVGDQETKRFV